MRKVVKQIVLLAVLCLSLVALTLCVSAETYTGECGENLTYTLDTDTGMLTISGTGKMADYNWHNETPWSASRSLVRTVEIASGVTSIGKYAFSDCSSLTSITIPDSVTSIGMEAFSFCSSLNAVYITDLAAWCKITFDKYSANPLPYAHNLYLNGELVTDLVVPDGVTSIGERAFYGCSSLTSINIPDSVTSIGLGAFWGCSSLTSARIGNGVLHIGERAFFDCGSLKSITLGNSVANIESQAFGYCGNLTGIYADANNPNYTSVDGVLFNKDKTTLIQVPGALSGTYTIPDGVTSIGDHAFSYSSLTSVNIPDSVTNIGKRAFSASSLASVAMGNGVTSIGVSAFSYCSSLTSITIPDSVTSIGEYAFDRCSSLTSITVPDSVTSIGMEAFTNCSSLNAVYITDLAAWCRISFGDNPLYYAHNLYLNGELVTDLVIPDGVTRIERLAFLECSSLTSVTIPDSVTSIGEYAFDGCKNLTSIAIGNGVTSIKTWSFDDYRNLTSVTIGNGVASIGDDPFWYCSCLENITILNPDCQIGDSEYTIPSTATIHGYIGSTAEAYATKYWREFVHIHVFADDYTVDVPANCTIDGKKSRHCTAKGCTVTINDTVIPAGHTYGEWQVRTPAKCEETGVDYRVCAVCMQEDTRTTDKLGHNMPATPTEVEIPATFKAPGRTAVFRCQNDGCTYYEGGTVIPQKKYGDTNADSEVSKADLLRLQKYLAGWDVEIDEAAADCNGDGQISKADLLRLQKYLAGWDVKLGE